MEAFAASPLIRRENARVRHQALQFNGSMLTEGVSRRNSRASTPWAADLCSSQCNLSGTSRSQSVAATSQASTSPRHGCGSEGDSLDSLLVDDIRSTARPTRTHSRERRALPERSSGGFTQTAFPVPMGQPQSFAGYLGRRARSHSRPGSSESGNGREKATSWLWVEDVSNVSEQKAGRNRHATFDL